MAKMLGKEPDLERARKTLRDDLPPLFDYLERQVSDGEFLVGGAFGIADISVATQFVNLLLTGAKLDASRWPRLAGFVERTHARPAFAKCIEEERALFKPGDLQL